jgi:predicted TIM-barrel fold metal-dependent hydrolase
MMNLVSSYQLPARARGFIEETGSANWQLAAGNCQLFLRRCSLFRRMPQEATDELERAVCQLGFHGALVDGHTHGHYLDEDQCQVFWERVVDLDVPVYLHPTVAFQASQNCQDHPELLGAY